MISLGDVTAILMLTVVLVGFQVSEVVSFFQILFSHKNTNKDLQIYCTCPFMVHFFTCLKRIVPTSERPHHRWWELDWRNYSKNRQAFLIFRTCGIILCPTIHVPSYPHSRSWYHLPIKWVDTSICCLYQISTLLMGFCYIFFLSSLGVAILSLIDIYILSLIAVTNLSSPSSWHSNKNIYTYPFPPTHVEQLRGKTPVAEAQETSRSSQPSQPSQR